MNESQLSLFPTNMQKYLYMFQTTNQFGLVEGKIWAANHSFSRSIWGLKTGSNFPWNQSIEAKHPQKWPEVGINHQNMAGIWLFSWQYCKHFILFGGMIQVWSHLKNRGFRANEIHLFCSGHVNMLHPEAIFNLSGHARKAGTPPCGLLPKSTTAATM